jgi:hypothetical protein
MIDVEQAKSRQLRIIRELVARKKLVEGGWLGLRPFLVPADATEAQVAEHHQTFFASALHLFRSLALLVEHEDTTSEVYIDRMTNIASEIADFEDVFELRAADPAGSA